MGWFYDLLGYLTLFIFGYFIFIQLNYLVLLIFSISDIFLRIRENQREDIDRLLNSDATPPISIIIPAYNEAQTIVLTIKSLIHIYYRHKEIIVVNDGSTDGTLDLLIENFQLTEVPPSRPGKFKTAKVKRYFRSKNYPQLFVVDKENGGRVDALNSALNVVATPLFVAIDADTILPEDSILHVIRPFVTDNEVIAIGGGIGIGNNCIFKGDKVIGVNFPDHPLAGFQVIEFLRSFIFGRVGWNHFGGPLLISGAFGIFDHQHVMDCGGYQTELGDDMDLTLRLHRYMRDQHKPYKILFLPDLVAWTEAPTRLASLHNQRSRWQSGLMQALWNNKSMAFNPKYGPTGLLGWPHMFLVEGLAPIIEFGGYVIVAIAIALNAVYWHFAAWLFLLALLFPMVLSWVCLILDDLSFRRFSHWTDYWKVGFYIVFEQFGYRQYLVWVRLQAMLRWIKGIPEKWPTFGRQGFKG